MNTRNVHLVLLACALGAPLASHADTLTLPEKAPFRSGLYVPQPVKAECALETKVVQHIKAAASGFEKVSVVKGGQGGAGKSLDLKITGLLGTGGGSFSGPKAVTVTGTLREGGKVKGTFTAMRFAAAGAFGGGGTCAMLERCAKAIGKDVATWLKAPTMNAKLGDEK